MVILNTVLNELDMFSLRVQHESVHFQPDTGMVGHSIYADGLHTSAEKPRALVESPIQTIVSYVPAIHSKLNHFWHFIPNLVSVLTRIFLAVQGLYKGRSWTWNTTYKESNCWCQKEY